MKNKLGLVGILLTILGAGVGLAQSVVSEKQTDALIEEKVNQALAEKNNSQEEEES